MAEYTDRYIADVSQYVRNVEQAADEADKFGRKQDEAALAARKMALAANQAGEKAAKAQRQAAEAAKLYQEAAKQANDAAQQLARGEIKEAEAAKLAAQAHKAEERAIDAATRSMHEQERADIAATAAALANAKAVDKQADQFRQLARQGNTSFRQVEKTGSAAFTALESLATGRIALIAAAIAALPIAAQLAGAAIGLGLGGAILGIGVIAAAQSQKVQNAFSSMAEHVKAELKDMAAPLVPVLVKIAGEAQQAFDQLAPHIRQAFAQLAPLLDDFAATLLHAVGNLGPFIDRSVAAFRPLIGILGAQLPGLISNVTNQLARMAETVDPKTFNALLSNVNGLITGFGNLTVALERTGQAYETLNGKSQASLNAQAAQQDVWRRIGEALGIVNPRVSELTHFNSQAANSYTALANSAQQAADKMLAATQKMLGSYDATLQYDQATRNLINSLKENGHALSGNSEKALANRQALSAVAHAALQVAEQGGNTAESLAKARTMFIRSAQAAGLTKNQAQAAADKLGLVKQKADRIRDKHMKVTLSGAGGVIAQLDAIWSAASMASAAVAAAFRGGRAAGGYVGFAGGGPVGWDGAAQLAAGGLVDAMHAYAKGFPVGGMVRGPGTGTSDSIPAWLSNGEYVVNAAATRAFRPVLDMINYGRSKPSAMATMTGAAGPGGAPTVIIHVGGSVVTERNLVESVRKGLAGI
ncbi:MAG TPA: hypothetical protein VGF29_13665, partial [Hyphomicrobiaceae bacterium]